jgi:hypothetical protein
MTWQVLTGRSRRRPRAPGEQHRLVGYLQRGRAKPRSLRGRSSRDASVGPPRSSLREGVAVTRGRGSRKGLEEGARGRGSRKGLVEGARGRGSRKGLVEGARGRGSWKGVEDGDGGGGP